VQSDEEMQAFTSHAKSFGCSPYFISQLKTNARLRSQWKWLKKAVKKVGSTIKKGAKKVGSTIKKGAKKVGSTIKKGVNKVVKVAKSASELAKDTFNSVKDTSLKGFKECK